MRESSFKNAMSSLRRRTSAGASGDGGFATFTGAARGGWQRELASPKFRQVRRARARTAAKAWARAASLARACAP